jgi:hypothetical protein
MKKFKKPLAFLAILIILGQLLFLMMSKNFTATRFESVIYATTGIKFDNGDLAKLNEGAHYFGQTMIGWTKFPNFKYDLIKYAELPEDSGINMHAQERQNFIFTVSTNSPVGFEKLEKTKDFLQGKIDEYNSNTNTNFVLTNVDYEQNEIARSYAFGALITLFLTGAIGIGILFVRKEFFPPKLRL